MYWNKYKVIPNKIYNENDYIRELLDASYQGVKRLFILAYGNVGNDLVTVNSHKKYFLPIMKIEDYNNEIDGRSFYDQLINKSSKQYKEIRKVSTAQDDDYTTGCLLDFAYFEKNYRVAAADLSKQKALEVDQRVIQQIIFTGYLLHSRASERNNTKIFSRDNKCILNTVYKIFASLFYYHYHYHYHHHHYNYYYYYYYYY